jgi:hypothetical protein
MKVHRTITFHFECEISSCIFRDEYRQKVFKNTAIRKIIGPKRGKVIGEWRKLHKDKLHYSYSSINIIRVTKAWRIRFGWACGTHEREKKCLQDFHWKTKKIPL